MTGVAALLGMAAVVAAQTVAPPQNSRTQLVQTYLKLPLSFEANEGQTDASVKFTARGPGYSLFLTGDEAVLVLKDAQARAKAGDYRGRNEALKMHFMGANRNAVVSGLDALPGRSNYFLGSDPQRWRTGVPAYGKVSYENLYPGISLVYYGNQRQLEYDLVVAPGADPGAIRFKLDGLAAGRPGQGPAWNEIRCSRRNGGLRVAENGDLIITAGGREIRLRKPVVYQNGPTKRMVNARYVLRRNSIAFRLGRYDRRQPLVIDPVLTYSTFLGGSGNDFGVSIAVDSSGDAYVAGGTTSSDFPVASAYQSSYGGAGMGGCDTYAFECGDAFVSKIDASGSSLVYSTYLGGMGNDIAFGITTDSGGNAYVAGETYSTNFPITMSAYQTSLLGSHGAFVTKLSPAGSSLVYSTYLSGSIQDTAAGIAVDASGNAYVVGWTYSTDFPTTSGAFQKTERGGQDGFVTKVNSTGTGLVYSTYLGGSLNDRANGIAIDASGNAYVSGQTLSTNFPTMNAYQSAFGGGLDTGCGGTVVCGDAILTKLNAAGSALLYSTYLGGAGEDAGLGIAVDSSENAYMVGGTESANFPVTYNAPQAAYGGGTSACEAAGLACGDAFVVKVNTLASGAASLLFSSYFGGSGDDLAWGVALDSAGHIHVSGGTDSVDFPVSPNAIQGAYGGGTLVSSCLLNMFCGDAFILTLTNAGSAVMYSSYMGGSGDDFGTSLALSSSGAAYVTGGTLSSGFPVTTGAYDTSCLSCGSGASDAFISMISGTDVLPLAESPTLNVDFDGDGLADFEIWRPDSATWYISSNAGTEHQLYGESGDVPVAADFDGDGKSDIGLWRPSTGTWYYISSRTGSPGTPVQWGGPGDIPVPADYDGDGRADFAVWRPSNGTWYYISSATATMVSHHVVWGTSGDIPAPGDYDGDGKADFAVWRPATGTWYYIASSTGRTSSYKWGAAGDMPAQGDYDGDGRTDFAIWRPSTGTWWVIRSSTGEPVGVPWGTMGDIPVVGDYNGDGKNDYAVFRPSDGTWYINYTSGGTANKPYGETGDVPAAHLPSMIRRDNHTANYDGDRKADIAVWRPSTGTYYVIESSTGHSESRQWGKKGDVIVPGDYDGDGKTDYAIWRPSTGTWSVIQSSSGKTLAEPWGVSGDVPVPGDYDGDTKADFTVFRPSNGTWYTLQSSTGKGMSTAWGLSTDLPVAKDYDGDEKTDIAVWRPSDGSWHVLQSSDGKEVRTYWGASTDVPVNRPTGQQ